MENIFPNNYSTKIKLAEK